MHSKNFCLHYRAHNGNLVFPGQLFGSYVNQIVPMKHQIFINLVIQSKNFRNRALQKFVLRFPCHKNFVSAFFIVPNVGRMLLEMGSYFFLDFCMYERSNWVRKVVKMVNVVKVVTPPGG